MSPHRLVVLAPVVLLVACGGDKAASGPERKTAAGEVLGGSISDAMLPLDTVQSQSAPLRESAGESDDASFEAADASAADTGRAASASERSPDSEPAAAPSTSTSAAPAAEQ